MSNVERLAGGQVGDRVWVEVQGAIAEVLDDGTLRIRLDAITDGLVIRPARDVTIQ